MSDLRVLEPDYRLRLTFFVRCLRFWIVEMVLGHWTSFLERPLDIVAGRIDMGLR